MTKTTERILVLFALAGAISLMSMFVVACGMMLWALAGVLFT